MHDETGRINSHFCSLVSRRFKSAANHDGMPEFIPHARRMAFFRGSFYVFDVQDEYMKNFTDLDAWKIGTGQITSGMIRRFRQ